MCTQHEQATPGKRGDSPAHQFPEPSLYPVANHRRANRTANNKAYLRLGVLGYRTGGRQQVSGQGRATSPSARAHRALELLRAPHPRLLRQHDPSSEGGQPPGPQKSDGELLAALAAARGKDGAASTGTHPLAETVDLGPPTVVRLERTLAHWNSRSLGTTVLKSRADMSGTVRSRHGSAPTDMAQPVNGTGDPRTGQTGPLRSVKDRDFHNVSTAGDLGCGKSSPKDAFGGWLPPRDGETALQRTYTPVDEPVDNELRLAIRLIEPIAARARLRGEGSHR